MYPEKELMLLGADKSALRLRISARRAETALLVARAVKPLEAFDQAIATIRAMLPLLGIAALPVGFALGSRVPAKGRLLGGFLRWAPLVSLAVRGVATVRHSLPRRRNAERVGDSGDPIRDTELSRNDPGKRASPRLIRRRRR
jgi:hypothetical protein